LGVGTTFRGVAPLKTSLKSGNASQNIWVRQSELSEDNIPETEIEQANLDKSFSHANENSQAHNRAIVF
jgi:hypothetical protein